MKAIVTISDYIDGRYNSTKLEKLKLALEKSFAEIKIRDEEKELLPDEGVEVTISMSAKYQTTYVRVENWGSFLRVGLFEDAVHEALEERGFEDVDDSGEDDYIRIEFE